MPMGPTTVALDIEQFMVPAGPTGMEDPPLGWPDGVQTPPPLVLGTTAAGSVGNLTFGSSTPLTPAALIGGYASAPPYWQGSRVVANTASTVTVADPARHPDGARVVVVEATANGQVVFSLPGLPNVATIQGIQRLNDGTLIAPDPAHGSHSPAQGVIAIGEPDPAIAVGDDVEFTIIDAFNGPVAAGTPFTVAQPKDPVVGLSTGTAWAGVYRKLIEAGAVNGTPPIAGTLAAAEAAMKAIIDTMMSVPGLAPVSVQAGASAFWGVVALGSSTIFPGSTTTTPPPALASLSALMVAAGVSALALPPSDPWTPTSSKAAAALFAAALYNGSLGAQVIYASGGVPVPSPFL